MDCRAPAQPDRRGGEWMIPKKEPRHGWATVCGAKAKTRCIYNSQLPGYVQAITRPRGFPPLERIHSSWRPNFRLYSITSLTGGPAAGSLHVLKRERCVDLHPNLGLFLFHPATEFASSVGESARPPEPFTALGTLDAFLFGGSPHE